jgi:hypothetical protein
MIQSEIQLISMRVVEEEHIIPDAPQIISNNNPVQSVLGQTENFESGRSRPKRQIRRHRRHLFARFIFAVVLMFAIIAASVSYLIMYIAGPIIKAVDSVPEDFPKSIALYAADQAKVTVQSPENKRRLAQLISGLPEWSLEPFTGYLTNDLKTQIAAKLQDPNLVPENLTLSDLAKTETSGDMTNTVGMEWNNIAKSKIDIYDYYKRKLSAEGFTVKEKLSDYEIDLSFFKPGIEGAMSITDSFMKDNSSIVKMTINYLNN